jgi:asparagine synthase (glutamine-hydrolysing)
MCAIAGVFGGSVHDPGVIRAMVAAVSHRGPDDEGTWFDRAADVALGHRRLSIIDLSPAGAQPMLSAEGRFVLIFNGEIYNFLELRDALEQQGLGPIGGWRGRSDTEVFLQAIAAWGIERALEQSSGMFAFALWDRRERRLTLARDRFGEKPLYYGWVGTEFVFGSQLNALLAHPQFDNSISRGALAVFASRGHVPAPLSIYEGIFKLPPACMLDVTREGARSRSRKAPEEGTSAPGVRLNRYWSYGELVRQGLEDPIADEIDALAQLEEVLGQSVRRQSFADVAVGAFLSGGIDSSLVVALNQRHSPTPVRTFSIGFDDPAYNEAHHAKAVAEHLGTLHRDEYVTAAAARDVITELPAIYDEPFADPSQIPTHLVSRLARSDVKVVLTGDGGDELFAGYYHHLIAPRVWDCLQSLPGPVRRMVTSRLSRMRWQSWNKMAGLMSGRNQTHVGPKIQRALRAALEARDLDEIHRSLLEEWDAGLSPVLEATATDLAFHLSVGERAPGAVRMMYGDAVSYLPDDILCKVDRASMAVGLETRAPFLDHKVAEVAARIPLSMKIRRGRGKIILRKLLGRYVPAELVDRPKNGFAVPVGEWIRGPLRPWAEELLAPHSLRAEGWFDADLVASRWRAHLSRACDSTAALWAVLMFQSWMRKQRLVARLEEPSATSHKFQPVASDETKAALLTARGAHAS